MLSAKVSAIKNLKQKYMTSSVFMGHPTPQSAAVVKNWKERSDDWKLKTCRALLCAKNQILHWHSET